ncbi:hypothetical protein J6590_088409 [Homalodisca vitripennis]|nr:hypothetical protein J6590_088409 [Homalodisca vitripennis]
MFLKLNSWWIDNLINFSTLINFFSRELCSCRTLLPKLHLARLVRELQFTSSLLIFPFSDYSCVVEKNAKNADARVCESSSSLARQVRFMTSALSAGHTENGYRNERSIIVTPNVGLLVRVRDSAGSNPVCNLALFISTIALYSIVSPHYSVDKILAQGSCP